MPTLLLLFIVFCVLLYAFWRRFNTRGRIKSLPAMIKQAESTAQHVRTWILNSPIKDHLIPERKSLDAMQKEYERLKEHCIDDSEKLWALGTDWWAYNDAISGIIHARETLDTESDPKAHERYEHETADLYLKKKEIESRYGRQNEENEKEAQMEINRQ